MCPGQTQTERLYKSPSSRCVSGGEGARGKRQEQLHRTLSVVSIRLHKQTAALWAVSRPLPGPNEDRLCPSYQFGGIMAVYSCPRVQASARGRLRSGRRPRKGNTWRHVGSSFEADCDSVLQWRILVFSNCLLHHHLPEVSEFSCF